MEDLSKDWNRRSFIKTIGGASALLLATPLLSSWSFEKTDPKIAKIVAQSIGIDTHNHIDVPLDGSNYSDTKIDLINLIKDSGLAGICMTFAVDYQKLTKEGEAFERFTNGLNAMDKILEDNKIKRVLNYSDFKKTHKKKNPFIIQSVEGGHFLEGKVERLQIAYNRGVRHLGLLHDNDALVPLGDIYTNPPKWNGLTTFGIEVIKECNQLGILIDLTHCSNDTINMALKTSTKPMIISHTGLDTQLGTDEKMAKMMKPRLISKEQAKIVADSGGVIGVWTHLSDSPLEYAQNIKAMVAVTGINHVCIGTDTKLSPAYRPNENKDAKKERIGERTNSAWKDQKEGFLYAVTDALLKVGFTENDIVKISSSNFLRVFKEATL